MTVSNTPSAWWLLLGAAWQSWQAGCTTVRDDLFISNQPGSGSGGLVAPRVTAGEAGQAENIRPPEAGTTVVRNNAGSGTLNAAISFAWPGTIPGAGACRPAEFTGDFSCAVEPVLVPEKLFGSINLRLSGSTENNLLSVEAPRGQLLVFDQDMNSVLTALVTGSVDCTKQRLSAEVQPTPSEVIPLQRSFSWLNASPQPVTTGTLKGDLDTNLQTITGDIQLVFEPAPTCIGTFNLRASP